MRENNYRKWLSLVAMSLGVFMGLLDVTVVNVALPTMQKAFNESFNSLQWVLNAYTLVFAVTLLIVSKMGDMYGRKKIFIASLILFVIASVVNGMASSLLILDIGRGVQAVGGAGMMSLSMALVASNFDGKQRGVALGILGSVIGLSSASGPLVGGLLVDAFGWPSIFYVNLPVGIIAVIMTAVFVKETPSYGRDQKIDFLGMLFSAATLFSAIYGLIQKETNTSWAWTDMRVAGWLILAVVLLIAFIIIESKVEAPMMNLKMFKHINFVGSVIVAFALGSGIYAFSTYLTVLMQNYIGWSAFDTGVHQLAMSVWSLVLGPVVGILGNRFSKKWMIVVGMILGGIGFILLINNLSVDMGFKQLWLTLVFVGIANGIVNPVLNSAGMEGVAPHEMGMASGLLNVFRQFGTSFGVVILGMVEANRYNSYFEDHLSAVKMPAQAAAGLHKAIINDGPFSGHQIAFSERLSKVPFAHDFQQVVIKAFDHGMVGVSLTAAVIVLIGAAGAIFFMRDAKTTI
ncbi:drug:H+ antiporter-2 (14 Spanner) (DHA2) family drug resistance MFS transporter [Enterococcus devriesei]|uniref:Drug:H+ antiporter-2 (14 Spanner) (DHA2) family drug resistance MFS transporter n=2 Tax=Enterococcus devriesei TaxID=319970 RepID=A0A1L8SWW1_9ENTE|nr:drug:H+ antiporter-2 (14 Spanner) (DHA2) family drug resistance MFS transporter [Enterococcus devriesei]